MIDLKSQDPDVVRASQRARGEDPGLVDEALAADEERRARLAAFEELRAEQNTVSRSVGKASAEERPAILARAKQLAEEVKEANAKAAAAGETAEQALRRLSNVVVEGVPAGGEEDFLVLRHEGQRPEIADPVRDHLELAEGLAAIDVKRGAKVSGARFYFLTGIGARLELALLNAAMDQATATGFTPVITPTLVTPEIMGGTGFLGEHAEEIYHLPADDLYLTGTSEVALAGYHAGDILDLSDGPVRYAGWSTCYRREAGSYGKDTRGIIRVHQFNKVEMFSYTTVEDSAQEHERLLAWEEQMLSKMELPYRVIDVAAGDLGSSAARKFDCEAWLPSQQRYLELTSTSNCTTFQARRLKIRHRGERGNQVVATLNGTLATTRWLVAILENHQLPDGSVRVPKGLRSYLGGLEVLPPVTRR